MYTEFADRFSKILIENDFFENNFHPNSGGEHPRSFIKRDGPSLCIVALTDIEPWAPHCAAPLEQVSQDYKHVFVVNLLISEHISEAAAALVENANANLDQTVCPLYWAVDLSEKKILTGKNQPSKIFGLHKMLNRALAVNAGDPPVPSPFGVRSRNAFLTYAILLLNALILLLMELSGGSTNTDVAIRFGAMSPGLVLWRHEFYRLVTMMFVHFGVIHFLFNSVSLFIFGERVERSFGKINFLLIYFGAGVCAGLFSLFLTRSVSAGASGAISGLVGAAAAYTVVSGKSLRGLSFYIIFIFILTGMGFGLLRTDIDNFAHLGGLLTGLLLGFWLARRMRRSKATSKKPLKSDF